MAETEARQIPQKEIFRQRQLEYWQALAHKLENYRDTCGVSVRDMAVGLNVSGQKLYTFLKEPSKGISLSWSDLMGLWTELVDPPQEIHQKLRPEHSKQRQKLKQEGPGPLLATLGFAAPNEQNSDSSAQVVGEVNTFDAQQWLTKTDNPQVVRAIARLTSPWIQDESVRTELAGEVINLILSQGRPGRVPQKQQISDWDSIRNWPITEMNEKDSVVVDNYQKEIQKLMSFGKQDFVAAELYEIYQSVLEHRLLNYEIPNYISITNCESRKLSYVIENIDDGTRRIFVEAERKLSPFKFENIIDAELSIENHPVLEVAISCRFPHLEADDSDVIWRHSSTASHVENMLSAVKDGLGYPFDVVALTTRRIGQVESGTVRAEVSLADPNDFQNGRERDIHQGWWVEHSTVLAILKATVDATKRWLSKQADVDVKRYYDCFKKIAEVDEQIFISRASFYSHIPELNYKITARSIKNVEKVISEFPRQGSIWKYFERNIQLLAEKSRTAQLTQMHISLLEGDIPTAKEFLSDAYSTALLQPSNAILALNSASCVMFYNLMEGNQAFLSQKSWRTGIVYSLESNAGKLSKYIAQKGCIDIDAYLYASQFWGTVSYLEFYTASGETDIPVLELAAENFIAAAHYACRIGHMKRAIHWLAYASRTYCRLGNVERAEYYLHLAKRELSLRSSLTQLGDVEPLMTYSEFADRVNNVRDDIGASRKQWGHFASQHQNWSMSNIYIAQAEVAFLKEDYGSMLGCCCEALEVAVFTGFARLAIDSLFNLARAAEHVNKNERNPFLRYREPQKMWDRNDFTTHLYSFLEKLGKTLSWQDIAPKLYRYSAESWGSWSVQKMAVSQDTIQQILEKDGTQSVTADTALSESDEIHPFAIAIRDRSFLSQLPAK